MSPARSCLAVTTVLGTVVGTLLGSGVLPASAGGPQDVPLAECTDLAITFTEVGDHTFTATVTASVTVAGVFSVNGSHAYFGQTGRTSSTLRATVPSADTDYTYRARCVGGTATATVRTLRQAAVPSGPVASVGAPSVRVAGPALLVALSPRSVATRVRARATDNGGRILPVTCAPARVPPAGTFTVTCTSGPDSAGRVGSSTHRVHVRGASEQLRMLSAALPPSRLTELLGKAAAAAARDQGAVAVRQLGLAVDELRSGGLPHARKASALIAIAQAAHVLGHAIPRLHTVRPGEHLWSIVRAQLAMDAGQVPPAGAVADAVRRTQAANPRLGELLQPGVVLVLPGF